MRSRLIDHLRDGGNHVHESLGRREGRSHAQRLPSEDDPFRMPVDLLVNTHGGARLESLHRALHRDVRLIEGDVRTDKRVPHVTLLMERVRDGGLPILALVDEPIV